LLEKSVVVSLVILVFLLHVQSALVIVLTLPISVLIAFICMKLMGVSSNIMSLGGIAIAIGVLVDAAIVMTENVIRHCEQAEHKKGTRLTAAETLTLEQAEELVLLDGFIRRPTPELAVLSLDAGRITAHLMRWLPWAA
jgi:Cu/Ag efflux pump CusA